MMQTRWFESAPPAFLLVDSENNEILEFLKNMGLDIRPIPAASLFRMQRRSIGTGARRLQEWHP